MYISKYNHLYDTYYKDICFINIQNKMTHEL